MNKLEECVRKFDKSDEIFLSCFFTSIFHFFSFDRFSLSNDTKKIRNPKTTQKQLDPLLKNIEKILGILSIEEIVYITNKESKDYLFENTFCGKGILSKSQPRLPYEPLQLSPFEAFYLISELKKLQVVYEETNEIVPSQTLWDLFSQQNQNFSAKYGAYRYFRKKGWVPKSGLKFASDFVIYQKGPSYFHAK